MTWLDDVTLETVIVTTTFGQSFKGLKSVVHDDCIVLKNVIVLETDASTSVEGELVIPREQVGFIQMVGA